MTSAWIILFSCPNQSQKASWHAYQQTSVLLHENHISGYQLWGWAFLAIWDTSSKKLSFKPPPINTAPAILSAKYRHCSPSLPPPAPPSLAHRCSVDCRSWSGIELLFLGCLGSYNLMRCVKQRRSGETETADWCLLLFVSVQLGPWVERNTGGIL